MFGTKKSNDKHCSTCRFWEETDFENNDYSRLGECRRFPPSVPKAVKVVTEMCQRDHKHRVFLEEERRDKWLDRKSKSLDKEYAELRKFEESLLTTTNPHSLKHWQSKIDMQQSKIDKIECEEFDYHELTKLYDEEIGFQSEKGTWLLTDEYESCGEWKDSSAY